MFLISRRSKEKIVLPTLGITVHLLKVRGSTVKIGIEAPPEVKIWRQELLRRIRAEAMARPRETSEGTRLPEETRMNADSAEPHGSAHAAVIRVPWCAFFMRGCWRVY